MVQTRFSEDFFAGLEQSLPSIFDRETASNCLGGLISPKTMANLDSLGKGPKWSLKVGKKVAYEKITFLEWIKSRIK